MFPVTRVYSSSSTYSSTQSLLHVSRAIFVVHDEIEKLKKRVENIKESNNLTNEETIYFTQYSNVPRYKFTEFAKNKPKLARTIKFDKSTVCVISTDNMFEHLKMTGRIYGTGEFVFIPFSLLSKANIGGSIPFTEHYDTMKAQQGCEPVVLMDKVEATALGVIAGQTPVKGSFTYNGNVESSEAWVRESTNMSVLIDSIDAGHRVVFDETLLEHISSESIIVDYEVFTQLKAMLATGEKSNVSLAMDILANSDFKKSEFKIVLLLNSYAQIIQANPSYSQVNFRSLTKYFQKYNWAANSKVAFARGVIDNTTLTDPDREEKIFLVKDVMLDYINGLIGNARLEVTDIQVKI